MLSDESIVACIVVRRNQSLNATGLVGFLGLGFLLHLGLGLLAGIEGWWPVVAFVGGAFLVMAGAVYGVMAASNVREVITVKANAVAVEYGRRRARARVEIPRYGTRVVYEDGTSGRLVLRFRGTAIEIGSALSEHERRTLARRLRELIGASAFARGARHPAVAPA